jgi:hypothetical protein
MGINSGFKGLNQSVNEYPLAITFHSADLSVPIKTKLQNLPVYYNKMTEYQSLVLYRHEGILGEKP